MVSNNIVVFPKIKKNSPPNDLNEIITNVEAHRKDHIEFILSELVPYMFYKFHEEGFDLCDEACINTTSMMVESIRVALYNSCGLDHELIETIDKLIKDKKVTSLEVEYTELDDEEFEE